MKRFKIRGGLWALYEGFIRWKNFIGIHKAFGTHLKMETTEYRKLVIA